MTFPQSTYKTLHRSSTNIDVNIAGRETAESCFEDYPSQRQAKMLSRDAQRTEVADFAQQETIFTLYEHFQDTLQLGLPQSTERFIQIQTLHAQQRLEG